MSDSASRSVVWGSARVGRCASSAQPLVRKARYCINDIPLEAFKGDRLGQYSIRINDQFRVCFRWVDGVAEDVEITDYH
ncbi:MAG TPA: type II toxin-antitoxin system RelE/ParE family toxin [Candidatus Coprousia avicola]|nr:type II toxin-antitoxin system RelE/ParE family toxin [Candidatus Coprousia avicola]